MADQKRRNKEKINTRKRVSKFVKQMRFFDDLKQEDLADEIFVTRKAISKWETNISSPSVDSVNELSKAYNVTFEEVVHGKLLPEESFSKVFKKIIKNPLFVFTIILFIYFTILILSNYLSNNRVYYFDFVSNNYVIKKGVIYILNDNLVIDIPHVNNDNNISFIFKMDIMNKRKIIYKCRYVNNKFDVYYVKEHITKRMLRKNNIYLYIKDEDNEYIFNKIRIYNLNNNKHTSKDNKYCPFSICSYKYGLTSS